MPFVRHDGEVYTLENLENSLEREQDRLVAGLRHFREVTAKGDMPGAAAHDRENAVTAKTIDILRRLIDEEKTAMTTDLTEQAIKGYHAGDDEDGGFAKASPHWYGYRAGKALRKHGVSAPQTAAMGRSGTVNVWTAATRFCVIFGEDAAERVERISE